jgi:tRNA G10  N-methylase Trm11
MHVCFSACARKLSLADPRLSVPVKINLARKIKYGPHYRQLRDHLVRVMRPDVSAVFGAIVDKNATRANKLNETLLHEPTFRLFEDARSLHSKVPRSSVDLIITSPPYLGAQKYIRASSLSLGWLDLAYDGELRPLERKTIGREHFSSSELGSITCSGIKAADQLLSAVRQQDPLRAHIGWTYLSEMEQALRSMHSVLRTGGNLLMVTGPNTLCGHHFDTPSFLEILAHRVGFVTRFKLIDQIRSRGLMIKRNKTASIIVSEWVLCFTKPQ